MTSTQSPQWQARAALACLVVFLVAGPGRAAIPEPDVIYYGIAKVNGTPVVAGSVVVKNSGGVQVDSTTTDGSGAYVLRVRLEEAAASNDPVALDATTIGEGLDFEVNSMSVPGSVAVPERGTFVNQELDASGSGAQSFDVDGDSVSNAVDNCSAVSNPLQLDSDGNGIGDACESIVNPPRVARAVHGRSNVADSETGKGAVHYTYSVDGTEVTNAQYVDFLNAVAAADKNGLYSPLMGLKLEGGIQRSGIQGSYRYKSKPSMANKPVNFVSWLDAARYANWVENGNPKGLQTRRTTDDGTYDLSVEDAELNAVATGSASWRLPSEDEWYKAAYYDPEADPPYWRYPTRSDIEPIPALADAVGDVTNPGPEVVNYASSAAWNGVVGNVTSVASAGSVNLHGLADLGGNVAEWLGDPAEERQRIARGGSFLDERFALESIAGLDREAVMRDPFYEGPDVGFRLVPEPGSSSLGLAALVALAALRAGNRRDPGA